MHYQDCITGKIHLNDSILSGKPVKPIIGFGKNPFSKPIPNDMADTLALSMAHMISKEAGFYKNTVEKKIKNEFDLNNLSRVIEETYSVNKKYKKPKKENNMSFTQIVTATIEHKINGELVEEMSKQRLMDLAIQLKKEIDRSWCYNEDLKSKAISKEIKVQKKVLKKIIKYLDAKK